MEDLVVDQRVVIPAHELHWTATRAAGPGGQNVNKVATKVILRFDVDASTALPERAKLRLRGLAGRRLDHDGVLVITSDKSRSQSHNLRDARRKLAELIQAALIEPKRRRPTRPSAAACRRRVSDKRQRAAVKQQRRRPPPED